MHVLKIFFPKVQYSANFSSNLTGFSKWLPFLPVSWPVLKKRDAEYIILTLYKSSVNFLSNLNPSVNNGTIFEISKLNYFKYFKIVL